MKKINALAALTAVAFTALALTGCSATSIKDAFTNRHEETFATYDEASDGWAADEIPTWIPTDGTEIRSRATGDLTARVAQVMTESDPAATNCGTTARTELPGIGADWQPEEYPDDIIRCGDWEIMPIEGGWFGWYVRPDTD